MKESLCPKESIPTLTVSADSSQKSPHNMQCTQHPMPSGLEKGSTWCGNHPLLNVHEKPD